MEYHPTEFSNFQAKNDSVRDVMAQSPVSPGIKTTAKKSLYVRALFNYDHTKDSGLPQPGLSFKHGDVLHVINAGDDDWWQASLVGNHAEDGPKGLIPSKKRYSFLSTCTCTHHTSTHCSQICILNSFCCARVEKKSKAVQKNVQFTRGAEGDKARVGCVLANLSQLVSVTTEFFLWFWCKEEGQSHVIQEVTILQDKGREPR